MPAPADTPYRKVTLNLYGAIMNNIPAPVDFAIYALSSCIAIWFVCHGIGELVRAYSSYIYAVADAEHDDAK